MMATRHDDAAFARLLPKVELHAHLSGSISRQTLHDLWLQKKAEKASLGLEDPMIAIPAARTGVDIAT